MKNTYQFGDVPMVTKFGYTYPDISLGQMLDISAKHCPERTAIIFEDKEIKYKEFAQISNRIANGLVFMGVRKGDRVANYMQSGADFIFCSYGIWYTGAYHVPVNPMLVERELEYILNHSGTKVVFTDETCSPTLKKVLPRAKTVEKVVYCGEKPEPDMINFKDWVEKQSDEPVKIEINPVEDIANLLYTSGTTGVPKGSMNTHGNLISSIKSAIEGWGLSEGTVILYGVPMFNLYGLYYQVGLPFYLRSTLIIPSPRWDPLKFLEANQRYKPEMWEFITPMYVSLCMVPDIDKYDFSNVRIACNGGARLPPELARKFKELTGVTINNNYGSTEDGLITSNPVEDMRIDTIGKAVPCAEVKVFDDNDKEVPVGEVGEIVVRGPSIFKGYYEMPSETEEAMRSGWFHTGDAGWMDEDGYFHFTDRKKDLIITSGFNVMPAEVEDVLYGHPAVQDAAVVGVSDPYRGEMVKAYILLKPEQEVSAEQIEKFCRERLAAYKIPRQIEFVDYMPRTASGKVLRRAFKEEK